MKRRDFITLLGSAVAWPLGARAQQPTKILRVGTVAGNPKSSPQWVAFERRMDELGYQEGRNFYLRAQTSTKPCTRSSQRASLTSSLLSARKSA